MRWVVDAGPLAGTVLDLHVRADGSVEWRFAAGPAQGRVGRSRTFCHQPVCDAIAAVWFPLGSDAVSVAVDLGANRFAGFFVQDAIATPLSGAVHAL